MRRAKKSAGRMGMSWRGAISEEGAVGFCKIACNVYIVAVTYMPGKCWTLLVVFMLVHGER